jgi:type I restriction enzyme S subunit
MITDGTHQPPKFVDSGIPFLLVSNITSNVITYDTSKYITSETYNDLIRRTPIEIGDILLSTVGSYGHPAIVKDDRKFCFQRHIAYLKPDHEIVDSTFLHAAILSVDVQKQIESLVLGVAQKTLNLSAIKKVRIPLPNLEAQRMFKSFIEQSDKSKLLASAIMRLNVQKKILTMFAS